MRKWIVLSLLIVLVSLHGTGKLSRQHAGSAVESSDAASTSGSRQKKPYTLVGAGDIGSTNTRRGSAERTARILDRVVANDPDAVVFTAGDNAYTNGTKEQFLQNYHPTWGRHRLRTYPSPGNHDYRVDGAKDYLEYFCPHADDCVFPGNTKRLYYSYDLGNWHIISLDSKKSLDPDSNQVKWLQKDLAAHSGSCILAYWHHPYYSSGKHGSSERTVEFWKALYAAGADIVVAGHDHSYQRFAKQDLESHRDPKGIRSFVVGTGGKGLSGFPKSVPNVEAKYNGSKGVLKFTLRESGYDWEFLTVDGFIYSDSGSANCNHRKE